MELIAKQVTKQLPEYPQVCELMGTAFPESEQYPMESLMNALASSQFSFRAFYDEGAFVGIIYTIEDENYLFVFFLAVNGRTRSKGYGSRILQWLKDSTTKTIVLDVEAPDPDAENFRQREKRIAFYRKNGFVDTGYDLFDTTRPEVGTMYVLTNDVGSFDARQYAVFVNSFSEKGFIISKRA